MTRELSRNICLVILSVFLVLLTSSTEKIHSQALLTLDTSNIRLLHHLPNSEYIDIALSSDGHYLIGLNSVYSGEGYKEADPNVPSEQYEATYLEIWELDELAKQNIVSSYVLQFEQFTPPDFTKKIDARQTGFSRPRMDMSVANNNQIIAIGIDDQIRLYELESLMLITALQQNNWRFLEWSSDGNNLAYIADNELISWNVLTNGKQEFALPTDVIFDHIYPIADGWIVSAYQQSDAILIQCKINTNQCDGITYDTNRGQLFPIIYADGTIAITNYTDTDAVFISDFMHISNNAYSPSNRYIERTFAGEYGIWDIQNQAFSQNFDRSQTIAWLSSDTYFLGIDAPDVTTTVSLYKIGVDNPIQIFALGDVLFEDWIFLTEHLINATASMASSANILVASNDTFVAVNLTWTIIYIPIIR